MRTKLRLIAGGVSVVAVATLAPLIAPTVATATGSASFIAPTAGATVGGKYVVVEVQGPTATSDCDLGVTSGVNPTFKLDGVDVTSTFTFDDYDATSGTAVLTWNAITFATGTHTLQVDCNTLIASESINIDNTGDTVTLTAPLDGSTVTGTAVPLTATAAGEASIGSTIRKVDFAVDGQVVGTDRTAPYQVTWDSTSVPNGMHQISATANDSAGFVKTDSVTVDVEDPRTTTTLKMPASARYGAHPTARATVVDSATGAPVASVSVLLYRRFPGDPAWTKVGHGTTDVTGVVTWHAVALGTARYRAVAQPTATYAGSTSRPDLFDVMPLVLLRLSKSTAVVGTTVFAKVTLSPAVRGTRLHLEYFFSGRWLRLATFPSKLTPVAHAFTSRAPGKFKVRVVAQQTADFAQGVSPSRTVKFTKH